MNMLSNMSADTDSGQSVKCEQQGRPCGTHKLHPQIQGKCMTQRVQTSGVHDDGSEAGSVTVDFVIWLPFVLLLAMLVFEATAAFMTQASSWRTANHVARGVATGQLSIADATKLVENSIGQNILLEHSHGLLRVEISVPFRQIGIGMLSPWGDMRVSLFHRMEPHVHL